MQSQDQKQVIMGLLIAIVLLCLMSMSSSEGYACKVVPGKGTVCE